MATSDPVAARPSSVRLRCGWQDYAGSARPRRQPRRQRPARLTDRGELDLRRDRREAVERLETMGRLGGGGWNSIKDSQAGDENCAAHFHDNLLDLLPQKSAEAAKRRNAICNSFIQ